MWYSISCKFNRGDSSPTSSRSVKDVTKSNYAYDAINWAKGEGIIEGYPDSTFKPNAEITEAQFAKMLAEYLGIKDDNGDLIKATPSSHWSDTYYDGLASYGVPLNGYFDNGLRNKPVKRGAVASAISHLTGNANTLDDSINFMLGEGITTGQNPAYQNKDLFKFFGSNNNLTRAQVAAFLYRMHNVDIEEPVGIALVVHNNKEGLSLVGKANKGMNKLDSSLRLGKLGSETPSNGGGNNGGTNPKPPVENVPDFSGAKLPVSDSAKANDVNVNELNKSVDKLSSKTVNAIKNEGYEVSMAEQGRIVFSEDNLIISLVNSSGRANITYSKNVDADLVSSIIKDVTGYTVDKSKLHPGYESVINSNLKITANGNGNFVVYYTK